MSTSTNAILCFGIQLSDDLGCDDEPWNIFDDEGHAVHDSFDEWFYIFCDGYNVELVTHSTSNDPMYIIAYKDTTYVSRRGYPKEIFPENLVTDNYAALCVESFVGSFNIPTVGGMGWFLCSEWD